MLCLSTIGLSYKFSSSRVLFIDQDEIVLLLTMFDKTYLKDTSLILNYIKKEI